MENLILENKACKICENLQTLAKCVPVSLHTHFNIYGVHKRFFPGRN